MPKSYKVLYSGELHSLVESPPQKRVITVDHGHSKGSPLSRPRKRHYLYFPYVYFLISHIKRGEIYGFGGVQLFFSKKQIQSKKDKFNHLSLWNLDGNSLCLGVDSWAILGSRERIVNYSVDAFWKSVFNEDLGKLPDLYVEHWENLTKENRPDDLDLIELSSAEHFLHEPDNISWGGLDVF